MYKNIWRKEIQGELYTWKSMLWLVIASVLFSFTSYLLLTDKELSLLNQTELMFLLGQVILGVAFLLIAIDASSIITGEFEKETIESLFTSPLTLRDFILGKFLAVLTLWGAVYLVSLPYIVVSSSGSNLAFYFAAYVALLGTLGVAGFTAFIFAISLFYRSSKNTITTALISLLLLTTPALFSSTLKSNSVSQFISQINPVDNIFSALDNVLVDFQTSLLQNSRFILPVLAFCVIAFALLAYAMKKFNEEGIVKND
jgi:ABC-type transport system involved in multi-copper enzyme maturation permease subunit